MKNISKKFILMVSVFAAASIFAKAQSTTPAQTTDQQTATQQAAPQKFFNIPLLDDLKTTTDAAYASYKSASKEKTEAAQLEYLKAKRLYTVELEKQMPAYDKTTSTGQKIRAEFRRVTTSD
jgi:ABC-type polar amino acid transport system ATPase subunit